MIGDNFFYRFYVEKIQKTAKKESLKLYNFNFGRAKLVGGYNESNFPLSSDSQFLVTDVVKYVVFEIWPKDEDWTPESRELIEDQKGEKVKIFCLKSNEKVLMYPYLWNPLERTY